MARGRSNFNRTERVNSFLIQELSLLLHRRVKDPRVRDVLLVDVAVTNDFSHARIYYQLAGLRPFDAEVQKGLEATAPFLRAEVKKILRIHSIPNLHFVYDDSFKRGTEVISTLNRLFPGEEGAPQTPDSPPASDDDSDGGD